jgi:antirestriction protein ArdC
MNTYEKITDTIIEELEAGRVPWRRPWRGADGVFQNFASKHHYRGVNVFLLAVASMKHGFSSPYWLTYLQAKQKGAHVKAGSKGTMIVFWKWFEVSKDKSGATLDKPEHVPMLRTSVVFNAEQIEGLKMPVIEAAALPVINPIAVADKIVAGYPLPPTIETGEARAYYRPSADTINMPDRALFETAEEYYSTLFHELTHSTGHERRLNRKDAAEFKHFGDQSYSREELIAEMGSAFLCAEAGIATPTIIENQAAYLRSWLKVLRSDKKLVVLAAAQAQKAADLILDRKPAGTNS